MDKEDSLEAADDFLGETAAAGGSIESTLTHLPKNIIEMITR